MRAGSADSEQEARALGSLYGVAIGDALGMPTQCMAPEVVRERWGMIEGFEPGPIDNEISAGMAAGSVTDDTDQAIIVANALIDGGGSIDPSGLADSLMVWHRRMESRGSLDLLGPSTLRALQILADGGSVEESGRWGDTNGAAMRIAPVGIAFPPSLVAEEVVAASRITHNTRVALDAARAVAGAVSAGIEGATLTQALDEGMALAARSDAGWYVPAADVAARIEWARGLAHESRDVGRLRERIIYLIGTSMASSESVPAAFAILEAYGDEPWLACRIAASLGGDSDTIASMVGAIAGSVTGIEGFGARVVGQVRAANPDLGLERLAHGLLALRRAR